MKKKHKIYLRLNLMSLIFIAVSSITVTLAWFAYSGLADVSTEIGVKAWNIEMEKNGEKVSHDIVISLSEISPGMNTVSEVVKVKNLGDSDAQVKYSITSARILGEEKDHYVVNDTTTSAYVEDVLSHEYPFHVNINLSKGYALSKGTESLFEVSVSWPLDSDTDEIDSLWGTKAYEFQEEETVKKNQDQNYQIRPSIQIVISLTAEQYIETDISSDPNYNLGDKVFFDAKNNRICPSISDNCFEAYVIDVDNKLRDTTFTLLPDPNSAYSSGIYSNYNSLYDSVTSGWTAVTRPLLVEDLLKVVSTDITKSVLFRDNLSDMIIGDLNYNNRMNTEINRIVSYNGYYKFLKQKFGFMSPNNCYWTSSEYNVNQGFAVNKIDEENSKIYGEAKTSSCKVVPVIIAGKTNTSVDTMPPVITLLGSNPITIPLGSTYNDAGATAIDNFDGNVTSDIDTTNNVNANSVGTYYVTYEVTDSSGNKATSSRTVHVEDQSIKTLVEIIQGDLVSKNSSNYYQGSSPNNWLEFGQISGQPIMWRIIKSDNSGIKIIYEGTKNGTNIPAENGRINSTINNAQFHTGNDNRWDYASSRTYIGNWYTTLTETNKSAYVSNVSYPVGGTIHTTSFTTISTNEMAGLSTNLTPYGMIRISDYISTSTSPSCTGTQQTACATNNFLHKDYSYWTMIPLNGNSDTVFYVHFDGSVQFQTSSVHWNIRPIVNLNKNIVHSSGNGTLSNPYKISVP